MRIGRPFQLKSIQNCGDTFVTLRTKCRQCGKRFKIIAIEVFASEALYGSRSLDCMACSDYWPGVMEDLAVEGRDDGALVEHVIIRRPDQC